VTTKAENKSVFRSLQAARPQPKILKLWHTPHWSKGFKSATPGTIQNL